eukprot:318661_1
MEELLQLNTSMKCLTSDEFSSWIQSFNQKQISSFIFQSILNQIENAKKTSEIQLTISFTKELNNTAKEIINARPKCETKNDVSSITKFNKISYTTISKIASFLDFKSVFNFEKCSKSIYIGTRSPLSLYKMNEYYFGKCVKYAQANKSIYYFHRFQNINTICLEVMDFYVQDNDSELTKYAAISLNDIPIWNNLKDITINYVYGWWGDYGMSEFEHKLQRCNRSNIQTLRIICSCVLHDNLRKLFPRVRFLDFDETEKDSYVYEEYILPPDLKGLALNITGDDVAFTEWKRTEFQKIPYLESLHVMDFDESILNKCLNVKEICLKLCTAQDIELFASQNLPQLQRVYIDLSNGFYEGSIDSFQNAFRMLFRVDTINYICIKINHMNGLKQIITLLINHYRTINEMKRMKIHIIHADKPVQCDLNKLLSELIKSLNKC